MPFCCQVQSACVNFNFCDFDKDLIVNVDLANSNVFGLKFFRGPTTHHRRKNEQLVAMLCCTLSNNVVLHPVNNCCQQPLFIDRTILINIVNSTSVVEP